MQLHELKPFHKKKGKKRVGRGGKKGTYSGRGLKGQKSRAGRKLKPWIREFVKRYPKLRGYRQRSKAKKETPSPTVLNLEILEKIFNPGETVSPKTLLEKKIIRRIEGKTPRVKILGNGEITKALVIEGCLTSNSAKKKMEKVGGTIKLI